MDISVKERSSNFSADEVEKLKLLIEKHKDVLICKRTDAVSHQAKELAWNDIYRLFNSDAGIHRSIKQLKYKFDNLKKTARKDASKERQERRRTGGGRPDIPPASPSTGDWMRSIIVMSADGLEAKYDDDVIESVPKEPISTVNNEILNPIIIDQTSQTITDYTTQSAKVVLEDTLELPLTDQKAEKIDISESTKVLPVFDSGAPASLLRCPVSTPLKRPRERATVTPQALKKSFKDLNQKKIMLNEMKQNILDGAKEREEQEHQLRLKQKEELHVQALRHNEEKHAAEMHILKLKAQLLEMEIEKFNK